MALAACRRAMLSGAIRPAAKRQRTGGPGTSGSWRIRGTGGKGGALSPGMRNAKPDCGPAAVW
ncbi:hypothetical protein RMHFA_05705 [Roseomonas mucosa]|nr:hypothetical protein RMHFA_05705 [Roseomonas mucosa]